jgi:hypothetical protein
MEETEKKSPQVKPRRRKKGQIATVPMLMYKQQLSHARKKKSKEYVCQSSMIKRKEIPNRRAALWSRRMGASFSTRPVPCRSEVALPSLFFPASPSMAASS